MNKLFNQFIFLLLIIFNNNLLVSNGDPFDYIASDIERINNEIDFINKISQDNKIIIIFSYLNNFYGDIESDFYIMASLYTELKRQFAGNKNIEFYRSYMCSGIHHYLLDDYAPSMQIYYNGKKIKSISGRKNKNILLKNIIEVLQSNFKTIYYEEFL